MLTLAEALERDTPLWFLDVDGVVNCFPAPTFDQLISSQDWSDALVAQFKIWWRRPVVDFINRVHAQGLVQPIWLTTWVEIAVTDLSPALGLDPFPAITNMEGNLHPETDWWKWKRVKELFPQDSTRSLVWTDDQLCGAVRDAASLRIPEAFILNPLSNPGLEYEHLAAIERYLLTPSAKAPR